MVVSDPGKRPEYPIFFSPLERDDISSSQNPTAAQLASPPTSLRNFSYPTRVATSLNSALPRGPPTPSWELLNQTSNACPDNTTKAAAIPEVSCLNQKKRHPRYIPGEEHTEAQPALWHWHWHWHPNSGKTHQSTPGKRPRRSTLLSSDQPFSTTLEVGPHTQAKTRKSHSLGGHIFPHVPSVAARFKRNSAGKHKTTSSLDASPFAVPGAGNSIRPASSSGILVMNQLPMSIPSPDGSPPQSLASGYFESCDIKTVREPASVCLKMHSGDHMSTSRSVHSQQPSVGSNGRKRGDSTTGDDRRKGKGNKGRWLSQLKGWVSMSEPSAQAFEQHKKETYKRAGVALDDPRANAKLHIPATSLPPSAIKPSGPGPEPEEIARRRAENKRKLQPGVDATRGMSQGSRSSASQHSSSSSSFAFSNLRDDA